MEFIINGSTLIVTGDLGSNIFSWGGDRKLDLEWLSNLNLSYFFQKRVAVDTSEVLWDGEICRNKALDTVEERAIEEEMSPQEIQDAVSEFKEETDFTGCFETREDWLVWLRKYDHGETFFGEEWYWASDLGNDDEPYRHVAILEALKMISEQLSGQQQINSVLDKGTDAQSVPEAGVKK